MKALWEVLRILWNKGVPVVMEWNDWLEMKNEVQKWSERWHKLHCEKKGWTRRRKRPLPSTGEKLQGSDKGRVLEQVKGMRAKGMPFEAISRKLNRFKIHTTSGRRWTRNSASNFYLREMKKRGLK